MDINTRIVQKTGKNGKEFFYVEIYLTDTCKKIVFLNNVEQELIKLTYLD